MAPCVEFTVLEELIHCFLFATSQHLLKQAEGDFCDEELVVVPIVTLHLGTLSADLIYAVFVSTA